MVNKMNAIMDGRLWVLILIMVKRYMTRDYNAPSVGMIYYNIPILSFNTTFGLLSPLCNLSAFSIYTTLYDIDVLGNNSNS